MAKEMQAYPSFLQELKQNESTVFQIQNATGEGKIISYQVFAGIFIMYNDFHMDHYQDRFHVPEDLFCIDHCREGRMEYEISRENYSYMEAGDLKIDSRLNHEGNFSFPLTHYHGITIIFEGAEAARSIQAAMDSYPIDLHQLKKKFCKDDWPFLIQSAPSIDRIMGELYAVPEKIREPYFKLKILEILLYLDALELPEKKEQQPYFYKSQVEKIKAIHQLLTDNLEKHYTLEELAQRFDISATAMKNCFKAVYGYPVSTYMRIYRMNRAAVHLKKDKVISVTEIAGLVGYDSSSKFSAAFKKITGTTPLEYRKSHFFIENS